MCVQRRSTMNWYQCWRWVTRPIINKDNRQLYLDNGVTRTWSWWLTRSATTGRCCGLRRAAASRWDRHRHKYGSRCSCCSQYWHSIRSCAGLFWPGTQPIYVVSDVVDLRDKRPKSPACTAKPTSSVWVFMVSSVHVYTVFSGCGWHGFR